MPKSRLTQSSYKVPRAQAPIDLRLDANEGRALISAAELGESGPLNRYPDRRVLEEMIAHRHGLSPDEVVVTNGGDDAIDRICRAYLDSSSNLVMTLPGFEMIAKYASLSGAEVRHLEWWSGPLNAARLLELCDADTRVLALVTPNNPTGATIEATTVLELAEALPEAVILLDLAYTEFANQDLEKLVSQRANIVATKTFSKAWGLAGLRVGYAIGSPEIVGTIRAAGGPYPTSSLSIFAAEQALGKAEDMRANVERVKMERAALALQLKELGLQTLPSQANFLLADVSSAGQNGAWLRDALSGFGIGIRAWPDKSGPVDLRPWSRISLPCDANDFERLLHALGCALSPEALLFDVDGVLVDVSASYRSAIIETARHFGVEISVEDIAAIKARGNANNDWVVTHELLGAAGTQVDFERVKAVFEGLYHGDQDTPGLWTREKLLVELEFLKTLKTGFRLAAVTGRPRRDAERFVAQFGLEGVFETLVCMEDAPLKPNPAPVKLALERLGVERGWMFGDTPDDMRAARSAGVLPVGVKAPGEQSESHLFGAGAAWVLENAMHVSLPSRPVEKR
ncbi:TIGR01548 family HAD-type hydrolase [Microvenator marinus]|nr:TIGR01548 family HAD-type hydrolase [Microvenator marinus]